MAYVFNSRRRVCNLVKKGHMAVCRFTVYHKAFII